MTRDAAGPDLPAEFAFIARHFRPLAGPGSLDLSDDAAVLAPPGGVELVLAADAMVEGVHFLPDDPPDTVGRKLLRTNLSDLAAMGADPLAYLMTTAVPPARRDWLAGFAAGLGEDGRAFGIHVLGGDTVSTPGPVTLSLTILGTVPPGAGLRRSGARAGDELWVSGTIGDGALGLAVLTGRVAADADGHLARRYRVPEPRLALGAALRGVARAAMDVSDGLAGDLAKMLGLERMTARVRIADVPLSRPVRRALALDPSLIRTVLTGGDDYEILCAVPPDTVPAFLADARAAGVPVTAIGAVARGDEAPAFVGPDGGEQRFEGGSFAHF